MEDNDPEMVAVLAEQRLLHGAERVRFTLEHLRTGIQPRRLIPDLLAFAESWRPDVLVRDANEWGAPIVSELLDIPHARVEIHAVGDQPHKQALLPTWLQRLRDPYGLPTHSGSPSSDQYLGLSPFPASLKLPDTPIVPTTHRVNVLPPDDSAALLPAWIDESGSRPLVYVSLGTVFNRDRGPEVFARLLPGLRDVDAEIVLTVGHDLDPGVFGPQPPHIHLERFLPLGALLPRCSLVLFHGGSGTLGRVVAHGLPMVIVPLGSDQPENAARCAELGVSRTLDQEHLTPEHILDAVLDVLQTPSYRQSAERLRDEFNALPGPEFAVDLLERLARDKAPIIASP